MAGQFFNSTEPLPSLDGESGVMNGTYVGEDTSHEVVRRLQTVLIPFIFLFGLVGNVLAMGCFFTQPLRSTSCCLYLGAKCASDTAFLTALFVMWLHVVHVDIFNVQGVCQITVFVGYVSGFTSVWLVLAITYENYIRICRPHLTHSYCSRRSAVVCIASVVLFPVVVYSFALWTSQVLGDDRRDQLCMALIKFKDVLMVMTFFDTVLTLVLPSVVVVPLVIATLMAVTHALKRKSRLNSSLLASGARSFKDSLEAKVARFLLAVSLTFLLLHTPGHLIRLKMLVSQYILHRESTVTDITLRRLFETFYYFNFCCSIVIFLASGAKFRALFISKYCRKPCLLSSRGSGVTTGIPPPDEGGGIRLKISRRRKGRGRSLDSRSTCAEHSATSKDSAHNRVVMAGKS